MDENVHGISIPVAAVSGPFPLASLGLAAIRERTSFVNGQIHDVDEDGYTTLDRR